MAIQAAELFIMERDLLVSAPPTLDLSLSLWLLVAIITSPLIIFLTLITPLLPPTPGED